MKFTIGMLSLPILIVITAIIQPQISYCDISSLNDQRIYRVDSEDEFCLFINDKNWDAEKDDLLGDYPHYIWHGYEVKNNNLDLMGVQFGYFRGSGVKDKKLWQELDEFERYTLDRANDFFKKFSNKKNFIFTNITVREVSRYEDKVIFEGNYHCDQDAGFFRLKVWLKDRVCFAYMHVPSSIEKVKRETLFAEMNNFVVPKVGFSNVHSK